MSRTDVPTSERLAILAGLLSSQIRAKVLAYAVTHADTRFSLTELARALGLAISSVQHEAYKLQELGIFSVRREGASRRYALRLEVPLVRALSGLVVATLGVPRTFELALADLPGLVAGSLLGTLPAREGETALVLIGALSLETLEQAHWRVAWVLDAPAEAIELAFFQPADWLARRDAGHPLIRRLLHLPVRAAFGEVRAGTPEISMMTDEGDQW
jgi:DNA-binding transcriptional ArsR family regulator